VPARPPAAGPGAPPPPTKKRRKRWLLFALGIPAVLMALLAGISVYVFALHPGLTMQNMPGDLAGFASPWWSATRACTDLSPTDGRLAHSSGDATIDGVAKKASDVWKCTITPGTRDTTTAAYVIFLRGGPDNASDLLQEHWAMQRTAFVSTIANSWITQPNDPRNGTVVRLFWNKIDGGDLQGLVVSGPHGDNDKIYQLWRQHGQIES
jgi:hypothetical protein